MSRRTFIGAAVAASLPWPRSLFAGGLPHGFVPQWGYAAITWNDDAETSIEDIAAVGFKGIQLRSAVIAKYGDRPADLKKLLDAKGLELLCFSSGQIKDAGQSSVDEQLDFHLKNARFTQALGGHHLQVTSARIDGHVPTTSELQQAGEFLSELGRRTSDLGVRVCYHNHMGALSERPEDLAQLLATSDPRYVDLLLDVAHYRQGGGDPAAAVTKHKDRLTVVHLKDVRNVPAPHGYQFCELGRGRVDVPAIIAALKATSFRGPIVVELDAVPDKGRTPRECAETNKKYVTETLKLSL